MPHVLLDCALAIKRPVKELAELLTNASDSDKRTFNTRIGRTPFAVIGNEIAAGIFYESAPKLMPFLYGACYAALRISAAVAELDATDEMVTAKCQQITEACADLIQTYEAYADSIHAAHKQLPQPPPHGATNTFARVSRISDDEPTRNPADRK